MDKDFQTSFIPKKPLSEERVAKQQPVSLIIFFATLLFFAALVAAGGVYFYKLSLVKKIAGANAELEKAKAAFEPTLIYDLQTLDRRLSAAQEILNNHINVTPIFSSLSELTYKSIQFTKFSYDLSPLGNETAITVNMSGRARDYTSIALESDKLGENKYFHDPVFSNLQLDERVGTVGFDMTFTVDPQFVNFTENIMKAVEVTPPADSAVTTEESLPDSDAPME